jgi:hypothetical protein
MVQNQASSTVRNGSDRPIAALARCAGSRVWADDAAKAAMALDRHGWADRDIIFFPKTRWMNNP